MTFENLATYLLAGGAGLVVISAVYFKKYRAPIIITGLILMVVIIVLGPYIESKKNLDSLNYYNTPPVSITDK